MKTRAFTLVLSVMLSVPLSRAQVWIDTLYQIATENDVIYDTVVDFAGNTRLLEMDISYPVNDIPPPCGRPLLVCVHGGAWMSGTKEDANVKQWRIDFAKRGYVTASVNYRLGMFQPASEVHCNVTNILGLPWDCLNEQDTMEWYRALYRAMQDVNSSVRYLLHHSSTYTIDADNVFLLGESAGAFTVLQSAFMDSTEERPAPTLALPNALAPYPTIAGYCIQPNGWDTSIASMNLQRPDLGTIEGDGNLPVVPFTLRGVGAFYGGMFTDLFSINTHITPPAIYLFHQTGDIVVPHSHTRLLQGVQDCTYGFPASCGYMINRPMMRGSSAMVQLIDDLNIMGYLVPEYSPVILNTSVNCLDGGHKIDSYHLRTSQMAQLFASRMDTNACFLSTESIVPANNLMIYPNPAEHSLQITATDGMKILQVDVINLLGETIHTQQVNGLGQTQLIRPANLSPGIYPLVISTTQGRIVKKVIWQ